jgi:hypothetical protein
LGQLYYRSLYKEFFERFPRDATEFYAVSGYLGPDPVSKLLNIDLKSSIIYGLQRETPNIILHEQLKKIHCNKVSIFYSDISSHAKCYLWLNGEKPVRGLVGSANFSTNGLNNDFRETLIEVERQDLYSVKAYIDIIKNSSKSCDSVSIVDRNSISSTIQNVECELELYDPSNGQVQEMSGLNWGFANANVTPNDAYIPIRTRHIRQFPELFQPVFFNPNDGHRSRSKEAVELIWDDGVIMGALFEGSQPIDGLNYPKQISSIPNKNILGLYIRHRLGMQPVTNKKDNSEKINRHILDYYGRATIGIKLIQPGIYAADFSPLC